MAFLDMLRAKWAEDELYRGRGVPGVPSMKVSGLIPQDQPTSMDWLAAAGATPAWATNQPSWRAAAGGGAAGAHPPPALAERLTAASMNPAEQQRLRRLFTSPSINSLEAKRLFGAGFGRTPPAAPPPPAVQAAQIRAEAARDVQEMRGELRREEIPLLQQGKRDLSILNAQQRMDYLKASQSGDVALAEKTYGLARENALAVGGQRGEQAMAQLKFEKQADYDRMVQEQGLIGDRAMQAIIVRGQQDMQQALAQGNMRTALALKEITATAMANQWAATYKNRPPAEALIQAIKSLDTGVQQSTASAPVAPQAQPQAPAQTAEQPKPTGVKITMGRTGPEFVGGRTPDKVEYARKAYDKIEQALQRTDLPPSEVRDLEYQRDIYSMILFPDHPKSAQLRKKYFKTEE